MKAENDDGSRLDEQSDSSLLTRFVESRDQESFRVVVARHGPMVMAVCRGMLRREQDAEDAFQATFLVLANEGRQIRRRGALASWLHRTAYHTCLKASARIQRRKEEQMGEAMVIVDNSLADVADQHAQSALHEELNGLPEKYRSPLVICYLEGKSREEAARQLGCSVGVIKGRLERGRQQLRTRLLARGVTTGGLLCVLAGGALAGEALAESLIVSTVEGAIAHAGGQAAVCGVSPDVLALTEGGSVIMSASFTSKTVATSVLTASLLLGAFVLLLLGSTTAVAELPVHHLIMVTNAIGAEQANKETTFVGAQVPQQDAGEDPGAGEDGTILSRARVEKLEWVAGGRLLVFGGAIDPQAEPGETATEMWLFDQSRKVRLPSVRSRCFAVSRHGDLYATVKRVTRSDLEFRLYDPEKRELRESFIAKTATRVFNAYDLALSGDGKTLATCGFASTEAVLEGQGIVFLFDVQTKKLRSIAPQDWPGAVYCLALSPDGKKLATGRLIRDKNTSGIQIWNVADGSLIHQWPSHREMMWNMAFSPDGSRIASVGHSFEGDFKWNTFVSVHNVETGQLEHNLKGHHGSPTSVAFSPDGKLLASGGGDKTVRLWDLATGRLVKSFEGHEAPVDTVAFAPDGNRLASGDRKKAVRFWSVSNLGAGE